MMGAKCSTAVRAFCSFRRRIIASCIIWFMIFTRLGCPSAGRGVIGLRWRRTILSLSIIFTTWVFAQMGMGLCSAILGVSIPWASSRERESLIISFMILPDWIMAAGASISMKAAAV